MTKPTLTRADVERLLTANESVMGAYSETIIALCRALLEAWDAPACDYHNWPSINEVRSLLGLGPEAHDA